MITTLTNDFHNTEVRIRIKHDGEVFSRARTRRIARQLCGVQGCCCAGYLGARGKQELDWEDNWDEEGSVIVRLGSVR